MTAFNGWTFVWEHGRELASMSKDGTTWTNTYNADGLRIKRTNGSTTYQYVYNGSSLSQMTVGTHLLNFAYDASGSPMAVVYDGTTYYYVTNLQGDIVAILDSAGAAVVKYSYDAWGKPLTTSGAMATTLGVHNPLRYRGYVYDEETQLYYLQSRYYDPELARFVNGDSYASTGQGFIGYNMFAYCGNNPIRATDPSGAFFLYDLWNATEDLIWKIGAKVLKAFDYNLTGDLLNLSASGSNNAYKASTDSPIAQEIASNKGFVNTVRETYKNEGNGSANFESTKHSYEFPVS